MSKTNGRLYAPKHYWPRDDTPWPADYREATEADILAALRAGIETGEIKAALVDGEIGTVVVFDRKEAP
jgi:hypothetical protein